KYKTAQELWAAILKTFGGNEATKKTKKNILKQQYDSFKAEGSETLEQTFNRLQNHALVADKEAPIDFSLMANTSAKSKVFDNSLCFKDCKKNTDSLNNLDSLLESQILDKNKEGLGYSDVPPPPAQIYSSPKKDMSWTGLPEFRDDTVTDYSRPAPTVEIKNKDGLGYSVVPPPPAQIYSSPKKALSWTGLLEFANDTVTDYSRPSPTMESTSGDDQNINPSVSETEASPSAITPKPFIKFVKASDSPTESKIDKAEKSKKSPAKYAEQYKKTNKKPNIRGNQRNWNN
nr:hypothetical protein [Tanacetum cinerariifolium]